LKENLIEHHDYEAVSVEVWKHLSSWYQFDIAIPRFLTYDARTDKTFLDLYHTGLWDFLFELLINYLLQVFKILNLLTISFIFAFYIFSLNLYTFSPSAVGISGSAPACSSNARQSGLQNMTDFIIGVSPPIVYKLRFSGYFNRACKEAIFPLVEAIWRGHLPYYRID
jgi:hypothetical protein